jgi:two-component system sensor histidine kinase HupT/HoxJ
MEGAQRSSAIVDALKRFSAIDTDTRQRVNLAEAVQRALHWVGQAAPHRVNVHCHGLDRAQWVTGSANQLQQVLVNLIQNAYDAVEAQAAPTLTLTLASEQGRVALNVADNGPGIAAANLARIFDPFFTTKPVGKGTGLGLSISYGIVEQHGGTLSAANLPAGGACFTLTLPAAGSSAP